MHGPPSGGFRVFGIIGYWLEIGGEGGHMSKHSRHIVASILLVTTTVVLLAAFTVELFLKIISVDPA